VLALLGCLAPAAAGKKTITIGVIAKSESNPVFQAAKTGAEDAGKELTTALAPEGVEVKIVWRTPVSEDAPTQAQYLEQLVSQGVDGIAISCTNGDLLTPPIDEAVSKGVVVVTFDSDAPRSKRLAYYGIDDVAAGKAVMRELAKAMGDTGGPVAILGGNQTAPNLQARIRGVREGLDALKDKGFTLKNTYYHKETAVDGAAAVQQAQTANPDIAGWAMVGGWPLFTQNALDGVADKAKVVSVDTLPEQLDYVRKGQVQALIGQDCYAWGHESVKILVDKIHRKKDPAATVIHFDLAVVTKDNVEQYAGLWEKWLGRK
jgi:ribose transport system substrate-binding protein